MNDHMFWIDEFTATQASNKLWNSINRRKDMTPNDLDVLIHYHCSPHPPTP